MKQFFTFSDSEKQYLETITEENDAKLSPFATKNAAAVRNKKQKFDIQVLHIADVLAQRI